jgi:hypothetical protein
MTPEMTPERFEVLADAYGGDVARWPAAERDAAAIIMAADPAWAETVLAQARTLDSRLDAWTPPRVSAALTEAVVATAPRARPRLFAWLAPAGLGAGLAAACAAGVVLGTQFASPGGAVETETDALITAVSEDLYAYDDEDVDA